MEMKKIITQKEIQERIAELALEIEQREDKYNHDQPPVFICILNGAFMFWFYERIKKLCLLLEFMIKTNFA